MEINGIQLVFLDMPAEYTEDYNRWYDLDHMPEHVSKADVIMGRRYVADRSLRDLPASFVSDAFGGHPPYLSIYSFGGPLVGSASQTGLLFGSSGPKGHGIRRVVRWQHSDRACCEASRAWLRTRSRG